MKTLILAALMPLCAAAAHAQDWNGWYGGIGIVGSRDMIDYTTESGSLIVNGTPFALSDEDPKSSTGAYALIGRMWQRDALVFGVELDVGGGTSTFENPAGGVPCGSPPCGIEGVIGSIQTQGHLRGVVGYSMGPGFLGFASLGVARADLDVRGNWTRFQVDDVNGGGAGFGGPDPEAVYGASFGLGAQYRTKSGMILRGEVVHDRYEKDETNGGSSFGSGVTGAGNTYDFSYDSSDGAERRVKAESTLLRFGLIWQF